MRTFIASDPRIAKYEPLVCDRAHRFHKGMMRRLWTLEDLQAMGRAAVWDAILTWKKDGGAKFGTYVTHVVTHAFLAAKKYAGQHMRRGFTESLTREEGNQVDVPEIAPRSDALLDAAGFRQAVRDAVDSLDPRRKDIMERRFWREQTLEEIGAELGVTRERVRQLQEESFAAMRPRLVFLRAVGLSAAASEAREKRERQRTHVSAYNQRVRERRSA